MNAQADSETLWADNQRASALLKERAAIGQELDTLRGFEKNWQDAMALAELGTEASDATSLNEAMVELQKILAAIEKKYLETLLNGEADGHSCFLEIHAGAGGTESQDWAEMLLRLYSRWGEKHDYQVELIYESRGEEAGIKSAILHISGSRAFGWLKTERGVHRLVRISPFDANKKRHTSFASVDVYPEIDDDINIIIEEKDIAIDTYRASGAGGQHVNRTDSAVRITHKPSGIIVQCQNDRSQHKNRAQAMKMLKSRLYEEEINKKEAAEKSNYASKSDIGWGHQIRSYVLHPYQMVKDLRTGVETSNSGAVLDGDIDHFLEAALAQRATNNHQPTTDGNPTANL